MKSLFEWCGYEWGNGQPWGEAHPDKEQLWYADKNEAYIANNGNLILDINNTPKYFGGEVNQTKPFGCGYISSKTYFLYGTFHFEYILPIGVHLWPAIWLSGLDGWPPEIDIVEGWTGNGYFIEGQPNYRKFVGFNKIHPGVFYKENETVINKSLGNFGTDNVTYECYQKLGGKINTCDLYWQPYEISFVYNNHIIGKITDRNILSKIDKRMYVCLDCAVGNNFTQKDYEKYKKKGSPFVLTKFEYKK